MFGISELKQNFKMFDNKHVFCPVLACGQIVDLQRETFKSESQFFCPDHKIYISPSTFEYERDEDNLLWTDIEDLDRLIKIKSVKRESRIKRDNSEDAVTWNVFRYLEKNNLLSQFLSPIIGKPIITSELILWSFSPQENAQWSWLNRARLEFGETISRGSEPDIIVLTDTDLFFIEAKFRSGNNTAPSDETNTKKYKTGGVNWYHSVFKNPYQEVAVDSKKYELLRFWLLGTWIAKQIGLDFHLVNLVLKERDKDIGELFGKHILQTGNRKFSRIEWEEIHSFIAGLSLSDPGTVEMINYFNNKSQGYDGNGNLQRAFS